MTLALGGCGNTVKGIGTDIVGMGEDLMKEDVKNEEKKNGSIWCCKYACIIRL